MGSFSDPPFEETYKFLFDKTMNNCCDYGDHHQNYKDFVEIEECELPVVDLRWLELGDQVEIEACKSAIANASKEWGFFQVVNHGISLDLLKKMRHEQEKLFNEPFEKKTREEMFLNFSAGSYRWGSPAATCLKQLSWSEAFHIRLIDIFRFGGSNTTLSTIIEQIATNVSCLAQTLAEVLVEKMGLKSNFFKENCLPSTCYLRLNRYPPCPITSEVYGLMPHTDSDFLTILHQDQVGGLQLVKNGKWISVKPNPNALIINIGDLFQAWSNGVYKSVQHRVVTNPHRERFSVAYFMCPSNDTVIQSCQEPCLYRKFNFGEYRRQVLDDVQKFGSKMGLPRFLVNG